MLIALNAIVRISSDGLRCLSKKKIFIIWIWIVLSTLVAQQGENKAGEKLKGIKLK
jgi:hypothetical protein